MLYFIFQYKKGEGKQKRQIKKKKRGLNVRTKVKEKEKEKRNPRVATLLNIPGVQARRRFFLICIKNRFYDMIPL